MRFIYYFFIAIFMMFMIFMIQISSAQPGKGGAAYIMTNADSGNEILVFHRDPQGLLSLSNRVATGGKGSGGTVIDPLGSQGSLLLSEDGRWLFAVNAGSDSITVLQAAEGLFLTDTQSSQGNFPVSLTLYRNTLFVLNAGSTSNISGFSLQSNGKLQPLADSTQPVPPGGAQVGFGPRGEVLVVTDKMNSQIHVFPVGKNGRVGPANTSLSNGTTPFGFTFDTRGILLVSEAGSGAISSYEVLNNQGLRTISASVENGQLTTSWIAGLTRRLAFASNTGSNTISSFRVDSQGKVTLLRAAQSTDMGPTDMALSQDGRFLYALNAIRGTVSLFRVNPKGTLTPLGSVGGLPKPFAQGMAVR